MVNNLNERSLDKSEKLNTSFNDRFAHRAAFGLEERSLARHSRRRRRGSLEANLLKASSPEGTLFKSAADGGPLLAQQ